MAYSSSQPSTTAVLFDGDQDDLRCATCPMCHTPTSVTHHAIEAGGDWRCVRCGQHWDASRLAAVRTYAAWVAAFDRVRRRGTEDSQGAAFYRDPPTELLGGTA